MTHHVTALAYVPDRGYVIAACACGWMANAGEWTYHLTHPDDWRTTP